MAQAAPAAAAPPAAPAFAMAPEWVVASCVGQLRQLYHTTTLPFAEPFADYTAALQRARELEARLLQLDKEGAELRDENAGLHGRLAALEAMAAANTAAQLEEARSTISRLEREMGGLYRDKSNLLEEVVSANASLTSTKSALESTTTQLAQARAEVSALREQLGAASSALESERQARQAVGAEVCAALGARDAALVEAERLRAENAGLVHSIKDLQEKEASRIREMNRMHEELLELQRRLQQEAEMDRQANELIRQRAVAAALQGAAAAAGGSPGGAGNLTSSSVMVATSPLQQQQPAGGSTTGGQAMAAAPMGGVMSLLPSHTSGLMGSLVAKAAAAVAEWVGEPQAGPAAGPAGAAQAAAGTGQLQPLPAAPSPGGGGLGGPPVPLTLRDVMGLPPTDPNARPPGLRFPARQPCRVVPGAHKGGCNSLAAQPAGHFVASCGADRVVALWDVALLAEQGAQGGAGAGLGAGAGAGPAIALHGMTAAVNDCAFTCEGSQVVAAGADRSLHVWEATSGRQRHTLTGHSGPVTAVALSPMDGRLAVSVSEDRSFRLWDLSRGFVVRSVPCTKMPLCLTISRDGNTIVTGHLDGSVLLWDVRQCRAGAAAPLLEVRDQGSPVVCLSSAAEDDSALVVAAKDGSMRLWDFRGAAVLRLMKHPLFAMGTTGGASRPRCHVGVSPDGRLLAAPGADGSVWVWDMTARGGAAAEPKQLRGSGSLLAHREGCVAAAFSADMSMLVSADKAGGVAFWPLE